MTDRSLFISKAPGIMKTLMDEFSLKDFQAAGILGNIGTECNGFKNLREIGQPEGRGGYGWCQWTGPRRRAFLSWCEKNSFDWHSDEANLGYLCFELRTTQKKAIVAIKMTETMALAVQSFERIFEGAGVPNIDSRLAWAKIALDSFCDRT